MEISLWLAYVGVISLLILSPGPGAILCLHHGVKFGAVHSIPTILGGCAAALCLMSLSAFGLGVLLAASVNAFLVVKLIGAAYLVFLGISMWREGVQQVTLSDCNMNGENTKHTQNFKKGFMVGISNPKDIIFFSALFPNFISMAQPQTHQFVILAITWFVIDFAAMFLYSSIGLKVSPWFSCSKKMLRLNRCLGSFFITIGSTLAISSK
ncbi:LysE family transporter [Vibrio sp. ZSDZ34]|uniref:LysE family transporter n=1 Tax=Vibrio gelatinilyticus TaxID=2893468 RepID=A0A9X1WEJ1_9VIBR|nr:LysE family transporter [Vibrio gelatinilyticus]MCJ2375524.1 LysE family transporter [Vibrio gelatinilyticus]